MKNYLRSRRWIWLFSAAFLTALLPTTVDTQIALPGIFGPGQGSVVTLAIACPLLLAIVAAWSLTARRTHLSESALRNTESFDALLVLAAVALVVLLTVAQPDSRWEVPRNTILLVGMSTTVAARLSPPAATSFLTLFVVFVLTYGTAAPGSRFIRVLQAGPQATWPLAICAVITVAAGSALLVRESSRLRA